MSSTGENTKCTIESPTLPAPVPTPNVDSPSDAYSNSSNPSKSIQSRPPN